MKEKLDKIQNFIQDYWILLYSACLLFIVLCAGIGLAFMPFGVGKQIMPEVSKVYGVLDHRITETYGVSASLQERVELLSQLEEQKVRLGRKRVVY